MNLCYLPRGYFVSLLYLDIEVFQLTGITSRRKPEAVLTEFPYSSFLQLVRCRGLPDFSIMDHVKELVLFRPFLLRQKHLARANILPFKLFFSC